MLQKRALAYVALGSLAILVKPTFAKPNKDAALRWHCLLTGVALYVRTYVRKWNHVKLLEGSLICEEDPAVLIMEKTPTYKVLDFLSLQS